MRKIGAVAAALAALVTASFQPRAEACAPAPPEGTFVAIAEESAIIVWKAADKTQHFIRRALFRTAAKDFGFLVPTPSRPELAEAPDATFAELEDLMRPEVRVEQSLFEPTALCAMTFLMRGSSAPGAIDVAPPPVRVLEEKRVAGYDAVVLEADDAAALARWLGEHGYASRPALADWLRPYVERHWKITAFKVAGGGAGRVSTAAVRMSFATDRPFFPYREPADQREGEAAAGSRMLRVFFIGDARVDGAIGEGGAAPTWPGKPVWSAPHARLVSIAGPALPQGALGTTPWLTVLEDAASPRPGTDELYFSPAKSTERIVPEPVVYKAGGRIPLPIDVLLVVGGITFYVVRKRRRRGAQRNDGS